MPSTLLLMTGTWANQLGFHFLGRFCISKWKHLLRTNTCQMFSCVGKITRRKDHSLDENLIFRAEPFLLFPNRWTILPHVSSSIFWRLYTTPPWSQNNHFVLIWHVSFLNNFFSRKLLPFIKRSSVQKKIAHKICLAYVVPEHNRGHHKNVCCPQT